MYKRQWWGGALKASYRFYADNWGVSAHSAEFQLLQRVARFLYLRANYRLHYQTGVFFFTELADANALAFRSADSDLARFFAHTLGGRVVLEGSRLARKLRDAELNLGYEYYVRTNDLRVHIVSCGLGLRF